MSRPVSEKRPWLAALLGALVTGLGHLYLRRWRRALGWLAVLFGASALVGDPATLDAVLAGQPVDPVALAVPLVVGGLSVVDAYLLARLQNAAARTAVVGTPDGQVTHCPNCGEELDPDLAFCHWCTAAVPDRDGARADRSEGRER